MSGLDDAGGSVLGTTGGPVNGVNKAKEAAHVWPQRRTRAQRHVPLAALREARQHRRADECIDRNETVTPASVRVALSRGEGEGLQGGHLGRLGGFVDEDEVKAARVRKGAAPGGAEGREHDLGGVHKARRNRVLRREARHAALLHRPHDVPSAQHSTARSKHSALKHSIVEARHSTLKSQHSMLMPLSECHVLSEHAMHVGQA